MSTSRVLEIHSVQTLVSASYKGLRVSIRGGQSDVAARNLLSGSLADQPLTGTARRHGRVGDLVGTYWAGVYLVSERFRESVAELGASGWSTTPIQVPGVEVPLLLLSITGKCGPLFGVGGEQTEGGPAIGTFIDPQLWDGSDFFLPSNNNSIFVIGSVADAIQRVRLANVAFEPAGLQALQR
jgi:hypothetical protein